MSDEEFSGLMATNAGESIHDPFAISVLKYGPAKSDDEDIDDYADVEPELLTDIPAEEKLSDDDYVDDNIET